MPKRYYVYILTNSTNSTLYTGMTNDLVRRLAEHRQGSGESFAKRYNLSKLVYYEVYEDSYTAITREKQIKDVSRKRKEAMINRANRGWLDLSEEWEL